MTFPVVAFAFAFVLSFAQIGETYAKKTCDCGTAGHETECCWEITEVTKDGKTEKVLTISPGVDENGNTYTNVQMKNYQYSTERIPGDTLYYSDAPWATKTVTSVKVENGITNIGAYAFCGEKIKTFYAPEIKELGQGAFYVAGSLKDVYIPKVSLIKDSAFAYARALKSIEMPSVEQIEYKAFYGTGSLKSVDVSNITEFNFGVFWGSGLEYIGFSTQKDSEGCLVNAKGERLKNGNNTCLTAINIAENAFLGTKIPNCSADGSGCGSCEATGYQYVKRGVGCIAEEDCKDGYVINKESKMCNKIAGCSSFVDGACVCDKYYYKKEGGCVSFEEGCGSGWLEKNRECIEASEGCGNGYKDLGGWCNRVIYTPAEAAPLLTDENNMVTITFRK